MFPTRGSGFGNKTNSNQDRKRRQRAIDATRGCQTKTAQPGGAGNQAVALDLCRDQHERFRCR